MTHAEFIVLIPAQLEVNQPDVRIEWVALMESHVLGTPVSTDNLACLQKIGWLQRLFCLLGESTLRGSSLTSWRAIVGRSR